MHLQPRANKHYNESGAVSKRIPQPVTEELKSGGGAFMGRRGEKKIGTNPKGYANQTPTKDYI